MAQTINFLRHRGGRSSLGRGQGIDPPQFSLRMAPHVPVHGLLWMETPGTNRAPGFSSTILSNTTLWSILEVPSDIDLVGITASVALIIKVSSRLTPPNSWTTQPFAADVAYRPCLHYYSFTFHIITFFATSHRNLDYLPNFRWTAGAWTPHHQGLIWSLLVLGCGKQIEIMKKKSRKEEKNVEMRRGSLDEESSFYFCHCSSVSIFAIAQPYPIIILILT